MTKGLGPAHPVEHLVELLEEPDVLQGGREHEPFDGAVELVSELQKLFGGGAAARKTTGGGVPSTTGRHGTARMQRKKRLRRKVQQFRVHQSDT